MFMMFKLNSYGNLFRNECIFIYDLFGSQAAYAVLPFRLLGEQILNAGQSNWWNVLAWLWLQLASSNCYFQISIKI